MWDFRAICISWSSSTAVKYKYAFDCWRESQNQPKMCAYTPINTLSRIVRAWRNQSNTSIFTFGFAGSQCSVIMVLANIAQADIVSPSY